MDYYKLFDFEIEPFSNSPDPRLFYQSKGHIEVLQKLEISIRLKRGLNIITGDIGIGKTTISRQLVQKLSLDKNIEYFLILDPGFKDSQGFLSHIFQLLEPDAHEANLNENNLKERIKNCLFNRAVDENRILVLIIDEGQKLSLENLEVLREFLNFETNDKKMLQIVIFAQNEFTQSLDSVKNLQDRINFRYNLTTLNFQESRSLIQYRLQRSTVTGKKRKIFSMAAFIAIYLFSRGSPRKMVNLCHHLILELIINKKREAGFFLVRSCEKKLTARGKTGPGLRSVSTIILIALFFSCGYYLGGSVRTPGDIVSLFRFVPAGSQRNTLPISESKESSEKIYAVIKDQPFSPSVAADITVPDAIAMQIGPEAHKEETEQTETAQNRGDINRVDQAAGRVQIIKNEDSYDHTPSDIYGTVLVPPNVTVSLMINRVYGGFSPELLQKVLAYNRTISNPDRLLYGTRFNFPVHGAAKEYTDHTVCLLILQTRDFKTAFDSVMAQIYRKADIRILAFWYRETGYLFNVIIDKQFENVKKALIYLEKIQPGIEAVPVNVLSLKMNNFMEKR